MSISDQDRKKIASAIAKAEKKTSGEIFCVLAHASDDYRFIPLLWAALVALVLPAPLIAGTMLSVQVIFIAQLVVFAALSLVMLWWPVRIRVVPGAVKRQRAHRYALEQFLAHGLHTTEKRTGVLIFLSEAERHADVVADEAIYTKVGTQVWDEAVAALVDGARNERPGDGFTAAVEICGKVLAEHFPPGKRNRDELPNQLVEL